MAPRIPLPRTSFLRPQQSLSTRFLRQYATSTSQQKPTVPPSEQNTSRHDIVVDNQENTKTGFDSWASETADTAYSKQNLDPDEHREKAAKESEQIGQSTNPLDVSPANNEVSQVRDAQKEGLGIDAPNSKKVSSGGSPKKGAPGKKYEKEGEIKGMGSTRGMQ
ncbi:uncharacterized protein LTR77_002328 [Saxophila tyrrhenica]|uniref:Uncharacterized protein n=1 Tax=Saxophila tyrrhenica TaxID=1690608 RepID=A0AAV9PI73_9PEZI|nr:hypothetical protein LTR77_002328 [Saxophila tyrrhenica]